MGKYEVEHLYTSSDVWNAETGEIMNLEREQLFAVKYELLNWDINVFEQNLERLHEILRQNSPTLFMFAELMLSRSNITIIELYPTDLPMSYNETVFAEEKESNGGIRSCRGARLLLLVAVVNLVACMSDWA